MSRGNFFLVEFKVTVDLTFLINIHVLCGFTSVFAEKVTCFWSMHECMKDVHILYLQNNTEL